MLDQIQCRALCIIHPDGDYETNLQTTAVPHIKLHLNDISICYYHEIISDKLHPLHNMIVPSTSTRTLSYKGIEGDMFMHFPEENVCSSLSVNQLRYTIKTVMSLFSKVRYLIFEQPLLKHLTFLYFFVKLNWKYTCWKKTCWTCLLWRFMWLHSPFCALIQLIK